MVRTKLIWLMPLILLRWDISLRSQVSDSTERQGSVYTLRVYQDLVIVDVVVTDKKGNAVKNLKPDNFTLYEDNVPQKISTFDFEDLSTTGPPPGEAANGTAPPAKIIDLSKNPLDQLPKDLFDHRRLMILYLDLSSMPVEDLIQAQKAALDYIDRQLSPADLVAVVVNASQLKIAQNFTNDREALRQVVHKLYIGDSASLADLGTVDPTTSGTSAEDTSDDFVADETQFNIFNTDRKLSAIESVGKMCRDLPGKKFLVYFSSGISTTGVENQAQLRSTIDTLNQANTSFYAVDARGLIAAPPGGDASKGSSGGTAHYTGAAIRDQFAAISNSQETLTSLSLDTGGKALLDTNNLGQVFETIQQDSKSYYLLGYNSSNLKKDGKYRRFRVTVNIPGVRVSYRPGYYSPKSFTQFTKSDKERQLEEAVAAERPFSEIPFLVATQYVRADDRQVFVPVSLKFSAADIPFEQKGKKAQADFDFIGQVLGAKNSVISAVRDTIRVNLDEDSLKKLRSGGIQYQTGFYLKPGEYYLKFLLRENQTGKLSTFEQSLAVPNFGESKLSMSSIILSNRLELANQKQSVARKINVGGEPTSKFHDPLVVDEHRIVPSVARLFSPKDTLYIFFQIYPSPAKRVAPDLKASLVFFKNGERYRGAGDLELNQFDEGSHDTLTCSLNLPLNGFPPGDYALQVNIEDQTSKDSLNQRINFAVH
jgi:VWFA-related protein